MTEALDAVMNQPRRVRMLSDALQTIQGGIQPLVDLYRPYVSGLDKLPADGRFLLVGNHTQQAQAEILLIPHYVRRVLWLVAAIATRISSVTASAAPESEAGSFVFQRSEMNPVPRPSASPARASSIRVRGPVGAPPSR